MSNVVPNGRCIGQSSFPRPYFDDMEASPAKQKHILRSACTLRGSCAHCCVLLPKFLRHPTIDEAVPQHAQNPKPHNGTIHVL